MLCFCYNKHMKYVFEFLLTLIIFYGTYTAFTQATPLLVDEPQPFWVIVASFVAAFLMLAIYALLVRQKIRRKYKENITLLKDRLAKKEDELNHAFKIKHDVEEAAEASIKTSQDTTGRSKEEDNEDYEYEKD